MDIADASNKVEADVFTSPQQRPQEEQRYPDDLDPFWQAVEEHFDKLTEEDRAKKAVQPDITVPEPERSDMKQPPKNEQRPDYLNPDWKSTPEGWQRFNEWADGQEAVRKAKAEDFNLDLETGELTPAAVRL